VTFIPGTHEYTSAQLAAIHRSEQAELNSRAYRGGSYPGGVAVMDAVSAYPAELVSRYRVPTGGDTSWMVTPLVCQQCGRQGNPGFIGDGTCRYCLAGIN
jgi:hypothetical protein